MQNILNIKQKMESQARMEFSAARMRLSEEEEKLICLHERKDMYLLEGRKLLATNLDVQKITENKTAIICMNEYIEIQILEVRAAEKNLEIVRVRLQAVMQERKMHERLKEKAFDEFMLEENARESKVIDELVSYRFGVGKLE